MQLKVFVLPVKNLGATEGEMNAFLHGVNAPGRAGLNAPGWPGPAAQFSIVATPRFLMFEEHWAVWVLAFFTSDKSSPKTLR